MLQFYTPSESELMAMARQALAARGQDTASGAPDSGRRLWRDRQESKPEGGGADTRAARRQRSLRSCHRYALEGRERHTPPADTGAFVPAASANIENDRNLTDGARRCARKIMEEAYRRNRAGRALEITVSYLAEGLGRCRRTVQYYLRLLEEAGYIDTTVIKSARSRLCTGLVIRLLAPLFPRHHRKTWPEKRRKPGAQSDSQNQSHIDSDRGTGVQIPVREWARRCMDGVFRALMETDPLGKAAAPTTG